MAGQQAVEQLTTMVNLNEKTVKKISCHVIRRLTIDNTNLHFVTWNLNSDFIAAGGTMGNLRTLKVGVDPLNAVPREQAKTISANTPLEGHQATVLHGTWNERMQKLTTSDTSGLIIVWGLSENTWVEEMINNRNKSAVAALSWNAMGTKIAICYADGNVIIGTVDGNRLWNKELEIPLAKCEWCPIGDKLIFGTVEGKVLVYDMEGNPIMEVRMPCLDTLDLEMALARRDHRDELVTISYYSPPLKSPILEEQRAIREKRERKEAEQKQSQTYLHDAFLIRSGKTRPREEHIEMEKTPEPIQPIPADRPRLMMVYSAGALQLMRTVEDQEPVLVRLKNLTILDAKWSPNGALIGVCGVEPNKLEASVAIFYFLSAYGQTLGYFEYHKLKCSSISWDSTGLCLTAAHGPTVLVCYVRPTYKYGSIEDTLVYVYQNEEPYSYSVMFYDYKTEEKKTKIVKFFENLACSKEHCVVVHQQEDADFVSYYLELCNSIGTVIAYTTTMIFPKFVCVNATAAVVACEDRYYIWHFDLPKAETLHGTNVMVIAMTEEYDLEEQQRAIEYGSRRSAGSRQIVAICIGDTFFLIAVAAGGIYRVNLSDGVITTKHAIPSLIQEMKLNCDFTRLAVTKLKDSVPFALHIYDFMSNGEAQRTYKAELSDIWDFHWDLDNPNLLVYKYEFGVCVLDGPYPGPKTPMHGYIFSFKNLVITGVHLDKILMTPENPTNNAFQEIMISAKSEMERMLKAGKFEEAVKAAENNPHAELWNMIADAALLKYKYDTAEHAFVQLKDYAGVQFIKQLRNISSMDLQRAEILAYMNKLEEAKLIFLACDRKDLAIEMYQKVDEPLEVYNLIKNDDDEEAKMEAYRDVAEHYYDDMEWKEAAEFFQKCGDTEMIVDCYVKANEFGKLEELTRSLDDDEQLEAIGDIFTSRGMCDQAIECYLKCKIPRKAFTTCIELNQWQKAQFIADTYRLKNVDPLLGRDSEEFTGGSDERSMNTLGLYMRAGRHLDAAKIAYDIAKDRKEKNEPYEELKKCYVLVGILVENHRGAIKDLKRVDKHRHLEDALADESGLSVDRIRILENTWRGAEAFHFMILALQHFFKGEIEDALQTSVILADYEEYLDPAEVHQMIALAAANCGQFKICSRAMMRLEAYDGFSDEEREEKKNLSIELFSKNPPVNPKGSNMKCPSCTEEMNRYDLECAKCEIKFPICVATGRPIHENSFWMCRRCKHHANQYEITKWKYCPLCHDQETFSI